MTKFQQPERKKRVWPDPITKNSQSEEFSMLAEQKIEIENPNHFLYGRIIINFFLINRV